MWQNSVMLPFAPRFEAIIDTVIANNPAEKAGFLKNDKIAAMNGKPIM